MCKALEHSTDPDTKAKPTDDGHRDHLVINLAVTRFSLHDFNVSQRSRYA